MSFIYHSLIVSYLYYHSDLVGVGVCFARRVCLDEPSTKKLFTYHWIHGHQVSRSWALARVKYQSEDLELILWDVVQLGRVRFGLQWDRCRFGLCFAFGDNFLVGGGNLVTSFCR